MKENLKYADISRMCKEGILFLRATHLTYAPRKGDQEVVPYKGEYGEGFKAFLASRRYPNQQVLAAYFIFTGTENQENKDA